MRCRFLSWTLLLVLLTVFLPGLSAETSAQRDKATFAGGCFWCIESLFDKTRGVVSAVSGYTGGTVENPTYRDVSTGKTGHAEAVELEFDPAQVSYRELLETFWKNIDPTQVNGQFYDLGTQYRTAVFYHSEEQKKEAEAYKKELEASGRYGGPIVTEIAPAGPFYPAEEYHQDYHVKNAEDYERYSEASGRKDYVRRNQENAEKKN